MIKKGLKEKLQKRAGTIEKKVVELDHLLKLHLPGSVASVAMSGARQNAAEARLHLEDESFVWGRTR
jgi:hypothetical protein